MNGMQKAVVKNMNWANDVPTYQVSRAIATAELDAMYAKLKPKGVTVSALLAKAVGVTLAKHPIMNAAYADDAIKYNSNIDVAMAVALPDGGLVTPANPNPNPDPNPNPNPNPNQVTPLCSRLLQTSLASGKGLRWVQLTQTLTQTLTLAHAQHEAGAAP